jgi:hypothetical protein
VYCTACSKQLRVYWVKAARTGSWLSTSTLCWDLKTLGTLHHVHDGMVLRHKEQL